MTNLIIRFNIAQKAREHLSGHTKKLLTLYLAKLKRPLKFAFRLFSKLYQQHWWLLKALFWKGGQNVEWSLVEIMITLSEYQFPYKCSVFIDFL